MSVRKLKSGKWIADVVIGYKVGEEEAGKPDRRSKTFDTKKQAQHYERVLLLRKEAGRGSVSDTIKFDEFLEEVYWPQKKGLRPDTIRGYKRDINLRLSPAFGSLELVQVNRLRIQKMIDGCDTPKIARNARETLSSILGVAVEMEIIDRNPASYSYQYPKSGEEVLPYHDGEVLGKFSEHRRVLEYVHGKDAGKPIERVLVLGLCFGLRKGEIFGLDWENVDFEKREIDIVHTYVCAEGGAYLDDPKTQRSRRIIPMTSWAFDRMGEWRKSDAGDGAVVKIKAGTRMNPRTGLCCLNTYKKNNPELADGIPFPDVTIKSLRHSFATACIEADIEVSRVSKWLGHTDVSTTYNRYVRSRLADIHESVKDIDAAFGV